MATALPYVYHTQRFLMIFYGLLIFHLRITDYCMFRKR